MAEDLFEKHGISPHDLFDKSEDEPSYLSDLMNYQRGTLRGSGQALGDIASSIGNFGLYGLEKLTGHPFKKFQHPHLLDEPGQSIEENLGREVGRTLTPFILPTGIGGASAKFGGPLIRALTGATTGALTGAAQDEEHPGLGAITGGAAGSLGGLAPWAIKLYKDIQPKNIVKTVTEAKAAAKKVSGQNFEHVLNKADQIGANKFLSPQKANIQKLKRAGDSDLLYSLEEYNKSPTVRNAHNAQTDLAKYASSIGKPKGTLERTAKKEAIEQSKELRSKIHEAFRNSGHPSGSALYNEARQWHKENYVPYDKSKAIRKLESGEIRAKNFPKELIKEESFLTKMGKAHPELIAREKIEKLKKNKVAQWGAGLTAASILPYEIGKHFR